MKMITPDRPKALQNYLRNNSELKSLGVNRVWFLKVATWEWPAIVFNEWGWNAIESANLSYEKWIDIFPVLIDVVVKYKDYKKWYDIRNCIRKFIWKFDWKLTNDWEGMIAFRQVLAPSYNTETDEIVFWSIYLFKQNFDYEVIEDDDNNEVLNNEEAVENANNSD